MGRSRGYSQPMSAAADRKLPKEARGMKKRTHQPDTLCDLCDKGPDGRRRGTGFEQVRACIAPRVMRHLLALDVKYGDLAGKLAVLTKSGTRLLPSGMKSNWRLGRRRAGPFKGGRTPGLAGAPRSLAETSKH